MQLKWAPAFLTARPIGTELSLLLVRGRWTLQSLTTLRVMSYGYGPWLSMALFASRPIPVER